MAKKKEYRTIRKTYPDEKMIVDIKIYPDQTEEEAIRNFEERRNLFKNPMKKVTV